MKNIKYLFISVLTALVMCSCGNKDVAKVVADFANASAAKDSTAMRNLYPDATFKMITLSTENISIDVDAVEGQQDTYKAMLNEKIEFIVKKSGDSYKIESSRGLLALPKDMAFAKGTGQYKAELSDAENAKRLDNKAFVMWVLGDVAKDLEQKVKVAKSDFEIISHRATNWYDDAHTDPVTEDYTAEIRVTVQNESNTQIEADAYSVVSSVYITAYFTEPPKCEMTTNVETKTIAPHSSMVLTYQYKGSGEYTEGMGWIDHVKSVLSFNLLNLNPSRLYKPKGNEYDEYMRNHPDSETSGALTLNMQGKLGGDHSATFILNGAEGTYTFVGAQRNTKLSSYDGDELVVDAYINGEKFGYFKGTYKDGRYKGIFKNTQKGASLDFDFTDN